MGCANNSLKVFEQIIHILDQIKDEDYAKPLHIFNDSTIGKHFRHILDFYACIVLSSGQEELDYARRDRSPSIEGNTDFAKSAYIKLQSELEHLDESQTLKVISDFHNSHDTDRPKVNSTIGRELMYAYDHAVHHLAIIKIGVKASLDYIRIDNDLGVAPSTIKYNQAQELNH